MKLASIKELSELLSMTRETVGKKLANMLPTDGPKGAKLYPSDKAIRTCLGMNDAPAGDFIDYAEAQRLLTVRRADQVQLEMECTRKERIPLEVTNEVNERAYSNVAGLLKAHEGKHLDQALIGDILSELRQITGAIREWMQSAS